jgi:hypothetical protein
MSNTDIPQTFVELTSVDYSWELRANHRHRIIQTEHTVKTTPRAAVYETSRVTFGNINTLCNVFKQSSLQFLDTWGQLLIFQFLSFALRLQA